MGKQIKPNDREELEIISVNQEYLYQEELNVELLGRDYAWLDTGTEDSMQEASNLFTIDKSQGLKIARRAGIAYRKGYEDKEELLRLADFYRKNE